MSLVAPVKGPAGRQLTALPESSFSSPPHFSTARRSWSVWPLVSSCPRKPPSGRLLPSQPYLRPQSCSMWAAAEFRSMTAPMNSPKSSVPSPHSTRCDRPAVWSQGMPTPTRCPAPLGIHDLSRTARQAGGRLPTACRQGGGRPGFGRAGLEPMHRGGENSGEVEWGVRFPRDPGAGSSAVRKFRGRGEDRGFPGVDQKLSGTSPSTSTFQPSACRRS